MKCCLFTMGIIVLLLGCSSTTRYEIARFFFDGVPPPPNEGEGDTGVTGESTDAINLEESESTSVKSIAVSFYSHSPYQKRNCTGCHDKQSTRLKTEGINFCLTCHETTITDKGLIHVPAIIDCLTCHNPHKSEIVSLLNKQLEPLCFDCHEKDGLEKMHTELSYCVQCHDPHESAVAEDFSSHFPFASKSCDICHDTEDEYALLQEGTNLCTMCHSDVVTEKANLKHIPAQMDCLICHKPHQSQNVMLLSKPIEELCLACHDREDVEELHGAILPCDSCHDPHESAVAEDFSSHFPFASKSCDICHDTEDEYALLQEGTNLCTMCHSDVVTEEENVKHIPAQMDCMICHKPHQSQNVRLLSKPIEELCLACHEREDVEELHGAILPCANCHDPHEAAADALLLF